MQEIFMLLAGTTGSNGDPWVRELMLESQRQVEAAFERLMRRGHEQGEITKNHVAASLSAARADWNLERLQVAVGEAWPTWMQSRAPSIISRGQWPG